MELTDFELTTKHLLLKPIHIKYNQVIFKEFTNDIAKYMLPSPSASIDGVNEFINSSKRGLNEGSNLQLVALDNITMEFIGCIGLHNVNSNSPELGLWIKKGSHGNGYGLEAISALIKWAKSNLEFEYLKYPVDKLNIASRRIPEKNNGILIKDSKKYYPDGNEFAEIEYWIYK